VLNLFIPIHNRGIFGVYNTIHRMSRDFKYKTDIIGVDTFVVRESDTDKIAKLTLLAYPTRLELTPISETKILASAARLDKLDEKPFIYSVHLSDYIYVVFYKDEYKLAVFDYSLNLVKEYSFDGYIFNSNLLHSGELGFTCFDDRCYVRIINLMRGKDIIIDNAICNNRTIKIPQGTIPDIRGTFYSKPLESDIYGVFDINTNKQSGHIHTNLEQDEQPLYFYYGPGSHFYLVTDKNIYTIERTTIALTNHVETLITHKLNATDSIIFTYIPLDHQHNTYYSYTRKIEDDKYEITVNFKDINTVVYTILDQRGLVTTNVSVGKSINQKYKLNFQITPSDDKLFFEFFNTRIPVGVILDNTWYIYIDVVNQLLNVDISKVNDIIQYEDKYVIEYQRLISHNI